MIGHLMEIKYVILSMKKSEHKKQKIEFLQPDVSKPLKIDSHFQAKKLKKV